MINGVEFVELLARTNAVPTKVIDRLRQQVTPGTDPRRIIDDVLTGFSARPWLVEPDRRAAISAALDEARAGDIVVIAGKGHEATQDLGTRVEQFDDRVVAAEEASRLLQGGHR